MAIKKHPKYKYLRSLTKREDEQLARGIAWMKKNPHKRTTSDAVSSEERRRLFDNP